MVYGRPEATRCRSMVPVHLLDAGGGVGGRVDARHLDVVAYAGGPLGVDQPALGRHQVGRAGGAADGGVDPLARRRGRGPASRAARGRRGTICDALTERPAGAAQVASDDAHALTCGAQGFYQVASGASGGSEYDDHGVLLVDASCPTRVQRSGGPAHAPPGAATDVQVSVPIEQVMLHREQRQPGPALQAQLGVDVHHVLLGGAGRDAQQPADLGVGAAHRHQPDHLHLAVGQAARPGSRRARAGRSPPARRSRATRSSAPLADHRPQLALDRRARRSAGPVGPFRSQRHADVGGGQDARHHGDGVGAQPPVIAGTRAALVGRGGDVGQGGQRRATGAGRSRCAGRGRAPARARRASAVRAFPRCRWGRPPDPRRARSRPGGRRRGPRRTGRARRPPAGPAPPPARSARACRRRTGRRSARRPAGSGSPRPRWPPPREARGSVSRNCSHTDGWNRPGHISPAWRTNRRRPGPDRAGRPGAAGARPIAVVGPVVPGEQLGDVGDVGDAGGQRQRRLGRRPPGAAAVPALVAQGEHRRDVGQLDGPGEAGARLALGNGVTPGAPVPSSRPSAAARAGRGAWRAMLPTARRHEGGRPPEVDHGQGPSQGDVLAGRRSSAPPRGQSRCSR